MCQLNYSSLSLVVFVILNRWRIGPLLQHNMNTLCILNILYEFQRHRQNSIQTCPTNDLDAQT